MPLLSSESNALSNPGCKSASAQSSKSRLSPHSEPNASASKTPHEERTETPPYGCKAYRRFARLFGRRGRYSFRKRNTHSFRRRIPGARNRKRHGKRQNKVNTVLKSAKRSCAGAQRRRFAALHKAFAHNGTDRAAIAFYSVQKRLVSVVKRIKLRNNAVIHRNHLLKNVKIAKPATVRQKHLEKTNINVIISSVTVCKYFTQHRYI